MRKNDSRLTHAGNQASGNFGTPITAALRHAGLIITIITRTNSTTVHPTGIPVVRTEYTLDALTATLTGQDAVICVVGPGGIHLQNTFIDAAEAAGVKRFIIDDFGWGPDVRGLPEFGPIHAQRRVGWDHAKARAEANPAFSWTGILTGNPIDWVNYNGAHQRLDRCRLTMHQALRKFPIMGFDVAKRHAIIYDDGTESFTGTTLAGIGQAVVGVFQHPDETANRFVNVRSIKTCQNELLEAFQEATGHQWSVERSTSGEVKAGGQEKCRSGTPGWVLDMVVAQLYDKGEARCIVAPTREKSDAPLLGVVEESAAEIMAKAMR